MYHPDQHRIWWTGAEMWGGFSRSRQWKENDILAYLPVADLSDKAEKIWCMWCQSCRNSWPLSWYSHVKTNIACLLAIQSMIQHTRDSLVFEKYKNDARPMWCVMAQFIFLFHYIIFLQMKFCRIRCFVFQPWSYVTWLHTVNYI
jgi:hypothetical protein